MTERTGTEWIAAFAAGLGVEPPTDEVVEQLLDLAGIAAHSSERIAAPIACWLIGRAGLDPLAAQDLAQNT
ncbi:MAG TPA: hypothetical protein DEG43_02550 [Acidimicrobiaceae bacterium]|jgi:hypothetical protein|nr:hypothetical protein [Acidimicrobiaceae bacterium]